MVHDTGILIRVLLQHGLNDFLKENTGGLLDCGFDGPLCQAPVPQTYEQAQALASKIVLDYINKWLEPNAGFTLTHVPESFEDLMEMLREKANEFFKELTNGYFDEVCRRMLSHALR